MTDNHINNAFDPEQYIQTDSGSLLACIKMLEAIMAGIWLLVMLLISEYISLLASSFAEYLLQLLGKVKVDFTLFAVLFHLKYPLLLPIIFLILIILDGIGVVLMRFGGFGESLVRFVHTIHWIALIIEIIVVIIEALRTFNIINQMGYSLTNQKTQWQSSIGLRIFILLFLLTVIVISLLFYCNYHHDIRVVLGIVSKERKRKRPQSVGKNHLAGRCTCFIFMTGISLVVSIIYLVLGIIHPIEKIITEETAISLPAILSPIVLLTSNFIINLLAFLKFITLRVCVRNFQKMHKL